MWLPSGSLLTTDKGGPQKLELSSGGQATRSTGFPHWVSVLGTHLYQCTNWWCCERLHLVWWVLFEESLNVCPFYTGWFTSAAVYTMLCVEQFFYQNQNDPHAPPSLFTWFQPKWLFVFFSSMKKTPQREMFSQCGRGETKNGRNTKRRQNQWVHKLFWAVEKHHDRCIASNGE